jgi:hypothetical protein
MRRNGAEKLTYHLLEAVSEPFPDVRMTLSSLMMRSGTSSRVDWASPYQDRSGTGTHWGVCRFESLGAEGNDHLQFFDTLDDLASALRVYFPKVELRSMTYPLASGVHRHEADWRCAVDRGRPDDVACRSFRYLLHPGEEG